VLVSFAVGEDPWGVLAGAGAAVGGAGFEVSLGGGAVVCVDGPLEPEDPGRRKTGRSSSSFGADLNVGFLEVDADPVLAASSFHDPCARQFPFSVSGVEIVNSPTGVPVRNPSYTVPGSSAMGTGEAW
jgi:hypothetical protein